ncbi:MAG: hypothetical protein A2408_00785 [Candidatus Yonathbacteria bacterium RIFOXYC1_FULL_52_10]|uniref:Uncharacterized protein n=1 Tax=Candidatus Yonathbacteria bacterium RIFOXYD1_FULL_52_36 TaxID=1802730 RepID=A0A1G2SJM4_9BACT|nr:MAG: hypothetical protein A2408_00785 [Candidatus Yonathbacteria bacterium RIFOXYC1_FULL_52_10]OHA85216.1 MAG: hypothetical protein A2591_03930 [Candidatus Yonathbacteria bacterium RIFOXYD1_FULL_52_36]
MYIFDENKVTYFGETDARNKRVPFGIKAKDRTRHMYVIGKTGMGKSTLLENMAVQDIKNGEGVAFIDPHGKTADLFLDYIPKERLNDVVYFAPFDTDHPMSFNIMEDVGYDKRHLVVSGLMSAFKKIWVDAWSARMEYILSNVLLALLEYPGSTLLGINRMLTDKAYRKKVVDNIKDPSVRSFWIDEFAKYTDRYTQEATPAIQNKVGQFTANPLIRNIVGQPKSSFDIRQMMDDRKILIINLSKGLVGEGNANLLGSMLITKIYLAAMSRADVPEAVMKTLPNFYLCVDEFQSFANESFADILSEARKYKLNLTMAHQYIEQMSEEVRAAVFGNVGTMVVFRVGAFDAEILEKEFAPVFTAEDLVNLGVYQIYLKLMIDGVSSHPFSATTLGPIPRPALSLRDEVIASSRKNYAKPRADVEQAINDWYKPIEGGDADEAPVRARPSGDAGRPPRDPQRTEAPRPPRAEDRRSESHQREGASQQPQRDDHRAHSERRTFPRRHDEARTPEPVSLGALKEKGNLSLGRREPPPLPESNHKDALKEALAAVLKREAGNTAPVASVSQPQPEKSAEKIDEPKEESKKREEKSFRTGEPAPKEVPEDVLRSILDISDET